MEPLDIDLALGAITGDNEKAEPIDMPLKIPIRLIVRFHSPTANHEQRTVTESLARSFQQPSVLLENLFRGVVKFLSGNMVNRRLDLDRPVTPQRGEERLLPVE
jgi:hypothetical protein